jgi:hypothetical protein
MKHYLLFFLFLVVSQGLTAQIQKGTLMVEGGINLGGNGGYWSAPFIGTTGISFRSSGDYVKNFSDGVTHSKLAQNNFSYSLAPKIGYSIFKNLVIGADFQYHKNIYKLKSYDHSSDKYRSALYGTFIRKYFGVKRLVPITEAGIGFGRSKSFNDEFSPGGGQYQMIEGRNIFYVSGTAGISYSLSTKFKINLLAKAQQTIEKPINTEVYHFSTSKIKDFDSALVLSFSYFFNLKNKEESQPK